MPAEEVERFEVEYVSLFALARQQGRHHLAVKKELEAAGVRPGAGSRADRGEVLSEGGINRRREMTKTVENRSSDLRWEFHGLPGDVAMDGASEFYSGSIVARTILDPLKIGATFERRGELEACRIHRTQRPML
jgi:hypothetical protein